jgi:hypothetical protein
MLANFRPPVDQNRCWFCRYNNPSDQEVCRCTAQIPPTRCNGKRYAYQIYSFGCNYRWFPSSQRLDESLLEQAVQILENGVLVVVSVGSYEQFAILIKDANGSVRCCAGTREPMLRWRLEETDFLQEGRDILESHADRTAGKASPTITPVMVLTLPRLFIDTTLTSTYLPHSGRSYSTKCLSSESIACFIMWPPNGLHLQNAGRRQ